MEMIVVSEAKVQDKEDISYILEHSAHATIFHTSEWTRLVSAEFGIPYYTLIARWGTQPVGMYTFWVYGINNVKRIISPLRDVDSIYGGPIIIKSERRKPTAEIVEVVSSLIMKSHRAIGQWVEYYKILPPPDYPIVLLQKMGYRCKKMFTSIIELNYIEEDLWRNLDSKRRNLVRKAMANKLIIWDPIPDSRFTISDFINVYYQMLLGVFGKSSKKPLPKSYYQRVIEELTPKGWVKPMLALYQDKPVGGAIFLCFKDTVYYWSGASFREYGHLAVNDLIQWEIIRWARNNNYKYYDLLIVEPERLPGIAHFKLGFGGKLVPIYEAIKRTPVGQMTRVVNFIKKVNESVIIK